MEVSEKSIDQVTEQILRYKLESAVEEMETALLRSAYSPIVKESQDASSAIFDREGRVQAQAVAIPAHLEMMVPAMEAVLDERDLSEMSPGDVYMLNDPYAGGTHLPDVTLIRPVFIDGDVLAFSSCLMHHQDIGGKVPGSVPMDATEIYQEGLIIPLMKLVDEGEMRTEILDLLANNVRIPEAFKGDVNAQIGATRTGENRLTEIVEELGKETVLAGFDQLIEHAERLMRLDIEEIPDGEYSFYDFLDGDGVDHEPIRIEVSVEVEGSEMHLDFTGSSKQVRGPLNCVPASSLSSVNFAIRAISTADLPNNAGVTNPISVNLPKGSIVNANSPAPVNARGATIKRIVDTIFGALAQAIPERIPAASSGEVRSLGWGGVDENGNSWVYREVFVGGSGGRSTKNGIDVIDTDITNVMNNPVEAAEMEAPMRIHQLQIREDSAGPGRYRGGFGCHKQFEMLAGATFSHRSERKDTPPWGVQGGKPGTTGTVEITRASGEVETEHPSKFIASLDEGDVIDMFTPGGGGYGSPLKRPVEEVQADVQREKLSRESAKTKYGVFIGEDGTVDEERTRAYRDEHSEGERGGEIINRG